MAGLQNNFSNATIALMAQRVCKYFLSAEGCWKGERCPFAHPQLNHPVDDDQEVIRCEVCKVNVPKVNLEAHEKGRKHRQLAFKYVEEPDEAGTTMFEQKAPKSATLKFDHATDNFGPFPDEVLLYIFSLLPFRDLLCLSVVNSRWHRILQDAGLWR